MFESLAINRFHWLCFILWQIALCFCTQQIFPVFYNYTPERKCDDYDIYENSTSSCTKSSDEICSSLSDCKHISLNGHPPFHSSIETFDLYCDRAYYATVVSTCQFLGVLFGTVVYGHLGDHFGRRTVSLFGISIGIIFAMASGLSPSWPVFAALRFVVGSSIACVLVVFYTFILELILPQQRVFLRSFFNWGYARVIFTLICYFMDHWRGAAIVTAAVILPVVLCILLVLPESPKWLESKGKVIEKKKAQKTLERLTGVEIKDEFVTVPQDQDGKIYTMRDLLSNRQIAKKTAILCALWFSTSLSAFGSDLNSGNLAGDFYVNQFVSGIVTAFAKIFVFFFDEYVPSFDRRKFYQIPQTLMIICYAAIMALLIFAPEDDCDNNYWRNWAVIIINIIGVSLIEITWDACYLVAIESFPTNIRTIGMGTCSLFARCGALLAPQMAYLSNISKSAPYGVVCCIGVFSLLISIIFLEDTKGVDLATIGKKEDEKIELEC